MGEGDMCGEVRGGKECRGGGDREGWREGGS